ncbi:MAG: PP2C family protein-serine/threonine phosphatase [Betaproteobacteria bacterium]
MSVTELVGTAIACMLVALGLASVAAWTIRRRATERLLLLFGIWCVLYGVRLAAQQPAVDMAIGGSSRAWAYLVAFITYVITVPTGLFFEALVGDGWKQSVRRMWQLQAVYAVLAIGTDAVVGRPEAAMAPNRPIVLTGLVIGLANVWLYRRRLSRLFTTSVMAVGAAALLLAVVNENVGRPVAPSIDLEPLGVLVFVIALGYGVVGNTFRSEAELLGVQRELETARQIQRSLLPRALPKVRGLDVAVQYLPMTAVAGDFYDFVELGPTRTGILVADVSGHGVPAALVASMVKLAFSIEAERAGDPAHVLTAMNRVLSRQLDRTFVTAIYAVIDTERSTVTFANAGHPPPLIGRANRSVEEVPEHGLMMGFVPDAAYTNIEVGLRHGDRILFYTDGVIEARNQAGDFFDADRVKGWLVSAGGRDAAGLSAAALRELTAWCGRAGFEDDVTFVVAGIGAA